MAAHNEALKKEVQRLRQLMQQQHQMQQQHLQQPVNVFLSRFNSSKFFCAIICLDS